MRVLVLGTSSGAGKTTVCAMICRHLMREGLNPVPFKALNLSLNSYATRDGGEIGIGQAFQAWSCGLEPETDMNPILLKPSGGGVIQMVLRGKPHQDVTKDCPMDRAAAMDAAAEAYSRLSSEHGFVVCEGSGSPAELNLIERDIANVGLIRRIGIPAILVGDIERGGVFAAIYGTWLLIPEDVRPLVKGFVINRFRLAVVRRGGGAAHRHEVPRRPPVHAPQVPGRGLAVVVRGEAGGFRRQVRLHGQHGRAHRRVREGARLRGPRGDRQELNHPPDATLMARTSESSGGTVSIGTGLPSMRKRNESGCWPSADTASWIVIPEGISLTEPEMFNLAMDR